MATPLGGNSPQQILEAISGVIAPEQVILNRAAGFTDYAYPAQAVVNIKAGRTPNALTYQAALKTNVGFIGQGSTQDILMYAYNNGISMATIIG